jgi:PTH1 family peptidyl-tRNA hydrolase
MHLIVGLGNPGSKYASNRHNIGFMAVDEILHRFSFSDGKDKFSGLISTGEIEGHKVVVLVPLTFMNNSGKSVQAAASFYKIPPENIIVIHDDLDLEPTKIKIKNGGGDAGHNGLRSITQMLGTPNYNRIRVGIGHPGDKSRVHNYVLSDFSKAEIPLFDELCVRLADEIPLIIKGETGKALTNLALN